MVDHKFLPAINGNEINDSMRLEEDGGGGGEEGGEGYTTLAE